MLQFSNNQLPEIEFQTAVKKPILIQCAQIHEPFQVKSMEGIMTGKPGDWLMVGAMGEMYVCDNFIFNKTYQLKS